MAGGGEHFDLVAPALGVGTTVDRGEDGVERAHHQCVGVVIVVAVLVRTVDQTLLQQIVTREVCVQHRHQVGEGQRLFVEDELLEGCQTVGQAADTHELDERVVIAAPPAL